MDWLHYAVDFVVIGFLVLMSVVAVTVAIERMFFFRRLRLDAYADRRELELDLTRRLHLIARCSGSCLLLPRSEDKGLRTPPRS
jgi:biopolymer transport protein ExbB